MLAEYFDTLDTEENLNFILRNKLNEINPKYYHTRFIAEKSNLILQLLPQMKSLNFKITSDILGVATRKHSKFFIPELTHQDIYQYNVFFEGFYSRLASIIQSNEKISIVDLGCGTSHVSQQLLMDIPNIAYYKAIDFNENVIQLNNVFCSNNKVSFECSDILTYSYNNAYDYALMINVIRYINDNNISELFHKLFDINSDMKVIIYDNDSVIKSIIKKILYNKYNYSQMESFLIIQKL